MSFENNDVLANLFANAIRSPQPSTSSAASPAAARPSLAHSKSIGAEPSTPRRPQTAGKRVPRRSTASFSHSGAPTPVSTMTTFYQSRKGGSVSPPHAHQSAHHHHHHRASSGAASPFAGAKFSDSPSARAIPLPPTVWFEDDESPCPPSDTESISSFGSTSCSSSSSDECSMPSSSSRLEEDGGLSSSSPRRHHHHHYGGVRVTPLALIAAVSAL